MNDDNIYPLSDDDIPPPVEPECVVDVLGAIADVERRIAAVIQGKSPDDLKAAEIDLLDPAYLNAAAQYPDRRAVLVGIAGLGRHRGFAQSSRKIEKALTKLYAWHDSQARERHARAEAERAAAFRRAAAEADTDWPRDRTGPHPLIESALARNKTGPRPTFSNAFKVLRDDPRWAGRLTVNRLGEVVELDGKIIESETLITAQVAEWLGDNYDLHIGTGDVKAAIFAAAELQARHPVRDYLTTREPWDGVPTIARLLPEVLGIGRGRTEEDRKMYDLYQAYIHRFLISAVARAMDPGCKVDTILVLVGKQGAQKSGFFKWLASPAFFGDASLPIGNKDAPITMRATWIWELAEGASLSKKSAEEVKQFATIAADTFRHVYEKTSRPWPRHTVLGMTTNKPQFLNDETGSRRFWILLLPDANRIDLRLLRQLRDAVWSEAMALYLRARAILDNDEVPGPDCRWWFEPEEDEARAEDAGRFTIGDVWDAIVAEWLARRVADFTIADVLTDAVGMPKDRLDKTSEGRVRAILTRFGYRSKRARIPGGYRDVWVKDERPKPEPVAREEGRYVPTDDEGNVY